MKLFSANQINREIKTIEIEHPYWDSFNARMLVT